MKTFFLCWVMLSVAFDALGQGSVTYQYLSNGKVNYVFKPDPRNPEVAKIGGEVSDYTGFEKVGGRGYTAELWFAPGSGTDEVSLRPVEGSRVGFRFGNAAGLINGFSKLTIAGTFGGDVVTMQLRVWNSNNGQIREWSQALERGKSQLWDHILAGLAADGSPQLGTGSVIPRFGNFSLAVPEPSLLPVMAAGLLVMAWASAMPVSRRR